MLKFMVVVYRRPELTHEQFWKTCKTFTASWRGICQDLENTFRTLWVTIPSDNPPGWDVVVELSWDDSTSMEAVWASPQGAASDADLAAFADLTRTTWSTVEEFSVLE